MRKLLLPLVFFGVAGTAQAVDLLVSNFTDSPDPAVRGGTFTYSATITNNEADTGHNAQLEFSLDSETTYVSVSDSTNCTYASGTHKVTCSYATLKGDLTGPGSADVITVTVTVRSKSTAGSTVSATATISTSDPDTNAPNNSLTQITTIDNGADLGITLSGAPASVSASADVTYTAAVVNNGANTAGTVTATITLSPHLTYKSASGSGWSCNRSGQVVTCTRSNAAVGALPNISVVGQVTGATTGTITTTSTIAVSGSASDYNNANDSSTANVTVTTGTDLAVTKSASTSTPASGQTMSFTVAPRNNGPFAASNVVVTDTLPAGFVFQSASGSGWSCGNSGQVVTCTAASYAVGATNNITITVTAPTVATSTGYTNNVTISSDTADAVSSNNSGSASVTVLPDGVDLSLSKSRTSSVPVAQGGAIGSTLVVRNNGPRNAASGEVQVVDTLPAGETYVSASGSNWSCAAVGQTVTCTYNAALNNGSNSSTLTINTTASGSGTLTNSACTNYLGGSYTDPVSGNNCASAGISSTPSGSTIDLALTKVADKATLAWNDNTVTYTLTVTNLAGTAQGPATGVVVTDPIPGYVSGSTGVTASKTGGSSAATFNCTTGSTVTCTQTGGSMAVGEDAIFTVAVTRPLFDSSGQGGGKWTNTASVKSTDQGDSNTANNSASAQVQVDPVADITVSQSVTPSSVQAGTNATYVITVTNSGPSAASSVTMDQVFSYTQGTLTFISASPSTGSCGAFNTGTNTLSCALGSLARNATATVTVVIRPDYMASPVNPRTIDSTATVATSTNESNTGNNSDLDTLTVTQASVDLLVNNTDSPDPLGFVPASAGPTFPDNVVTYRNTITNRGPSVASGLMLTYTMTPPNGKTMTFLGDKAASTGQVYSNYCNNLNSTITGPATLTITCTWPGSYILAASNSTTDLYLDFRVDTQPSATGDTYSSSVSITSSEPESVTANNSVNQTTTVRMRADLQLAKSAMAWNGSADATTAIAQIRQPFYWVLTLTNAGPGDSQITTITDTLPSGVSLYSGGTIAPYNAAPYNAGMVWTTNNGTPTNGTCSGTSSITCNVGLLESGKVATVKIPVVVSGSTGAKNNCASATTSEVDPNSANNTSVCYSVTVQSSSIAGTVYSDLNNDGAKGGGENGINAVSVNLSGTDSYGNSVNSNGSTNSSGNFSFTNLSPGSYTLTETQPSGYQDGKEAAGSAGGTVNNTGFSSASTYNTISGITLPANTNANSYLFGELANASIAGYVFIDLNSNAVRDGGETNGLTSITMTLTGTDDTGAVNATTSTGASGAYSFTGLRPGSYQVQEATISGLTHTGMYIGSKGGQDGGSGAVTNSAVVGASKRTISTIPLVAGDAATNYNFGETGQGLSGYVYIDLNNNGVKDAGEVGISGVNVTLSGNTSTASNVCTAISPNPCTIATDSQGAYSFLGLPASDATGYVLTEQSQASAPLTNYADGIDSVGQIGGGNVGTMTNDRLAGIVIALGQVGTNYNFGELGASLAGSVYHDVDANGSMGGSDTGIAGVTVTLSGTTTSGANVCTLIASCTRTTDASGNYSFTGLPASNGSGYTLTETQPVDYVDSSNNVGTGPTTVGTAGTNTFTGIVLGTGQNGINYRFGEKTGSLTGYVYLDANNNGVKDGGETGIAGVTVTLTGTAASGAAACVGSCVATTDASGQYSLAGLRNANGSGYTVTETQPAAYLDGITKKGTENGGACASGCVDSTPNVISAIPFAANKTYASFNFGEVQAGTLAGRVWDDSANNNATYEAGEEIAGVTLTLSGTDDRGSVVNSTTTTAADGSYSFTGLRPSNGSGYTITETQPTGLGDYPGTTGTQVGTITGTVGTAATNAISAIVLPSGGSGSNYNFREQGSSIEGYVYVDANNNGSKDSGEMPLANVSVQLKDAGSGSVLKTAVTDGSGRFQFLRLASGSYTLEESQPTSYQDGKETAGSAGGTVDNSSFNATSGKNRISSITLPVATVATGYLFGDRPPEGPSNATLNGMVYVDVNGNGAFDGADIALPNIRLRLSNSGSSQSALTDSNGRYSFSSVVPGNTYVLTEEQPAAWGDFPGVSGSQPGTLTGLGVVGSAQANAIASLTFPLSTTAIVGNGYDFREKPASLAGMVYLDANANDKLDSTEGGLAGITVTLSSSDSSFAKRTAITDAKGAYRFDGLPAGTYTLTETQPLQYVDGADQAGSAGGSTQPKNSISSIALGAGVDATAYHFGEKPPAGASLAGKVCEDINDDGVCQSNEASLSGVTITLSGTTDKGVDICTLLKSCTTQTDAAGAYLFFGLQAGTYAVVETQPTSHRDGKENIGSAGGVVNNSSFGNTASENSIRNIVLTDKQAGTAYDFGERSMLATLSGRVCEDSNDDGVCQSGETGITGVTVTLSGKTDAGDDVCSKIVSCQQLTDSNGGYAFTKLPPGTYAVVETQPGGNYLDGKEGTGSPAGKVNNSTFGNTAGENTISGIVLPAGQPGSGYDFGERLLGALQGSVYFDANDDGVRQSGETGIAGVTITLSGKTGSGVDVCTLAPTCTATTGSDGSFSFGQLPPGSYVLTETQPTQYQDGRETAGSIGGTVNNLNFGTQPFVNQISAIPLNGGTQTGYLFGEKKFPAQLKPPIINGYVWFDRNHNRVRDPEEITEGRQGWTVELTQNGNLVCTVESDNTGFYHFDNLACGHDLPVGDGFLITFRSGQNNMPNVPVSGGEVGQTSAGAIRGLTLKAGDQVVEQNLPLDPSGVVYDSLTRQPVPNAVVTITGPSGFNPETHLLGGATAQVQTTGTDGMYQFFLMNNFPSGPYMLTVVAPSGYLPPPSTRIPACVGILPVAPTPNPALIQSSGGAPSTGVPLHNPNACQGQVSGGANSTQYYFGFVINAPGAGGVGGSAPILSNHIPIDPVATGVLTVTKTTPLVNVVKGDLVPYTITASNNQGSALTNVTLRDHMPPGFNYRSGSARLNGLPLEPSSRIGRDLSWNGLSFNAGETKTLKLVLTVGAGVSEGTYRNETWGSSILTGTTLSNVAAASVRVTPDSTLDCTDVIGKVFDDKNANGYQDQGEPGIPNVRVVTVNGLLITTDAEGRYHVTCADIPQADHGANLVIKLDERTLPTGYRLTTENPHSVRATRGKMVKLNFGATVHRVVRLELTAAAFAADSEELLPDWQAEARRVIARLEGRPSILRLAYFRQQESEALARARVLHLAQTLRQWWQEPPASSDKKKTADQEPPPRPPLLIETEMGVMQ